MRRKTGGIKANQRFAFILFVFMVILTVLFGRVLYWKVVHGAEFEAAAKNQQINRYDLVNAANRGSILDRNEQVLAVSTAVYNVVLDPLPNISPICTTRIWNIILQKIRKRAKSIRRHTGNIW